MSKSKRRIGDQAGGTEEPGLGTFLGGLGTLIERLGELAEKGEELKGLQEFGDADGVRGVYGFTIKTGIGKDRAGGVKVEPFGNVRTDERTGRATVHEVLEPMVDIFEESGHVLVVAEMPGVGQSDVKLELAEDILTITAERGTKKYHREVLLPASFGSDAMSHNCRNGVLEVKLVR